MRYVEKHWFPVMLLLGILVNATGLFSEIMEPDGALYAAIAKRMALSNDWVNLVAAGQDWLDKPHLPFWLAALSFKCFGINAFAYKLPAFICWLLGVWYTYQLAVKICNKEIAKIACIIYITSLHAIIANFDVRAEAYLTTFIIAGIYHIYRSMPQKWNWHLFAAAIFCAAAIMTKGIFVLVTILAGFVTFWLYSKQWKQFIQLKWYVFLVLTFIFILPEIYALYQQFDLHPEKIVFEKTNVSGIYFFFWDSQFGRFFNNGPIRGSGDKFFFFHTLLWAFLPWSVIAYFTFYKYVASLKKSVANYQELILAGSVLITFLMFSLSKFQLPHYIVIIFPQLSIMVAAYLYQPLGNVILKRWSLVMSALICIAILCVVFLIFLTGFNNWYWPFLLIVIPACIAFYFIVKQVADVKTLAIQGSIFSMILFFYLNLFFYPALLSYQSGMQAGKWLHTHNLAANTPVAMYRCRQWSFEFYGPAEIIRTDSLQHLTANTKQTLPLVLFTTEKELDELAKNFKIVEVLERFQNFPVSQLSIGFLNKNTRVQEVENYVLLSCR